MNVKVYDGGVTAAQGFMAAAAEANIKYKNRTDMALVYTEVPAVTAGCFTTNVVKAAPVKWDQKLIKEQETAKAVVLNSGIANACTGKDGDEMNLAMAEAVAQALRIEATEVLTASTGVIGMSLPLDKITRGASLLKEALAFGPEAGTAAAKAIMTTDTVKKECAVTYEYEGKTITVGGMSKGSGMIHPNMATMLSVVTTDAAISKECLQTALSAVVKDTFNQISVDRDTSTNDTIVVLANGLAGNPMIDEPNEGYELFYGALNCVCENLAKIMAADGEGATKLFTTIVKNADTEDNARVLAKSVITSNLVKTALYGSDANWGRIFCAMGYSGVTFDPDIVDLYLESAVGTIQLVENGMALDFSEEFATEILSQPEVTCIADMKAGDAAATAWGCDLTYDYVKINGDYRS